MARTDYSMQISAENIARGKANELPISPKHAIEIMNLIRGMTTTEAISYLEDVVALKKAVPFRRFHRNVGHRHELRGWKAGRYPVKASRAVIRLLRRVEKNAEYIGLDTGSLRIIHAAANRGQTHRSIFPRAMGRATPKRRETANLEIIVQEVG
ncbi:MAG: 50S ribosomal protein L22 [Methanoculleaceae archaeon]